MFQVYGGRPTTLTQDTRAEIFKHRRKEYYHE
jgi:hypothetical protein